MSLFDSGGPLAAVVSLVFYLILAVFVFASLIALYSLLKYGKNKLVILLLSGAYVVAMLALLSLALEQFSQLSA